MSVRARGRASAALAFLFLLMAPACGDDATAPVEDVLTETEVDGLVEALLAAGATEPGMAPARASAAAPARAPETVVFPMDESFPCRLGGSLGVKGSVTVVVDDETGQGSYAHELTQTHTGCRVRSERLGKDFVFDGDPSVVSRMSAEIGDGMVASFSGSEDGAIRWALDGRSGRCAVALDYAIEDVLDEASAYRVTGTICGRAVDEEYAVEG